MHTWEYYYDNYYDYLTEHLEFNDDDNGNWTITTDTGEFYYFEFIQGQWNQFDGNGNVVDMFPPISTLLEGETMEDVDFNYEDDYEDEEFYYEDDDSAYIDNSDSSADSDDAASSDRAAGFEDDGTVGTQAIEDDGTVSTKPAGYDASADRTAGTQNPNNSSNNSPAVVSGTINPNNNAVAETRVSSTAKSEETDDESDNTTLLIVFGSLVVVAGGLGTAYVIKTKKK